MPAVPLVWPTHVGRDRARSSRKYPSAHPNTRLRSNHYLRRAPHTKSPTPRTHPVQHGSGREDPRAGPGRQRGPAAAHHASYRRRPHAHVILKVTSRTTQSRFHRAYGSSVRPPHRSQAVPLSLSSTLVSRAHCSLALSVPVDLTHLSFSPELSACEGFESRKFDS